MANGLEISTEWGRGKSEGSGKSIRGFDTGKKGQKKETRGTSIACEVPAKNKSAASGLGGKEMVHKQRNLLWAKERGFTNKKTDNGNTEAGTSNGGSFFANKAGSFTTRTGDKRFRKKKKKG